MPSTICGRILAICERLLKLLTVVAPAAAAGLAEICIDCFAWLVCCCSRDEAAEAVVWRVVDLDPELDGLTTVAFAFDDEAGFVFRSAMNLERHGSLKKSESKHTGLFDTLTIFHKGRSLTLCTLTQNLSLTLIFSTYISCCDACKWIHKLSLIFFLFLTTSWKLRRS